MQKDKNLEQHLQEAIEAERLLLLEKLWMQGEMRQNKEECMAQIQVLIQEYEARYFQLYTAYLHENTMNEIYFKPL